MRLTLRTLLAYLDGVLPAAARKELAPQVEGSAVAEGLAGRIRRVTARPEIPAPKPGARGLADDANSVAEFLDNVLSPDRLPEFEKICLESDMHLAEVSACHDILAQVVRDPDAVKPLDAATSGRLLHDFHHRAAAVAAAAERKEARENADIIRAALQTSTSPAADGDGAETRRAARRQRQPAWLARASAALAIVVLLLASGVLVWSVSRGGRRVAQRPAADMKPQPVALDEAPPEKAEANVAAPAGDDDAPRQPPPADEADEAADENTPAVPPPAPPMKRDEPTETAASEPVTPNEAGPSPSAVATSPGGQAVAATDPLMVATAARVPQGDALAIAAPPTAAADKTASPRPADLVDESAGGIGVVGSGGVLLHRVVRAGRPTWVHFPADSGLAEREELVAPPACDPTIDLGGVVVQILRGTQATLSLDADGTPRITVVFGRIVARAARGAGADKRLGISAGGLHGVVTAGLAQPVAASVEFERNPGDDPAEQRARIVAAIMSTDGGIGWRQLPMTRDASTGGSETLAGIAEEGMLEARSAITWRSDQPDRATMESRPTPRWAAGLQQSDAVERRAAAALGGAVQDGRPLSEALVEMATSRRAENRSVAAATLALLGEYDELVALLSADTPGARLEAAQWQALEEATVPLALARGANAAAAVRQAFVERGPRDKAERLFAMARGFSDADLTAGADRMLIESLDDEDLIVRRYAAKNLFEIVRPSAADRSRYRPDGLPEMRREGAAWWRVQLEKGLVQRPSHQ